MHSAGITQLVECKLPKLDAAGSSPVSRSKDLLKEFRLYPAYFFDVHELSAIHGSTLSKAIHSPPLPDPLPQGERG